MLGRVPVVEDVLPPVLYAALPVVVVRNWTHATRPFLEAQWRALQNRTYDLCPLLFPHWVATVLRTALQS